jgi:hypothetical protein
MSVTKRLTHVVKYAIRLESFSLRMVYTSEPGSQYDIMYFVSAELLRSVC